MSESMTPDGTIVAFKEMLHFVTDIRLLPEILDVEGFRHEVLRLRTPVFSEGIEQLIEEHSSRASLRKALYVRPGWLHVVIVEIEANEVIYDRGTTDGTTEAGDNLNVWAEYLWIPLTPLSEDEARAVSLSPFKHDILT